MECAEFINTSTLTGNLSNFLIIFERSFLLKFLMAYLDFIYLFGLALALRPREVINPFPYRTKLSFGYEDVIFILSKFPNFNKIYKVMYLSLPLISLCFLTKQKPHFFMFTSENSPTVNFYYQIIFGVEKT